ncbi:hypothetical protein QLX67_11215 [Balneolaceae bacterium ANBcel3]|nr:hypothetical protein [Balneolaceae bacterium ANBcel3]
MALYQYLNRIKRLDALIRQKRTGPPVELAEKLGISERWLYVLLEDLKLELGCPIQYDRRRQSYVYKKPGKVIIGFTGEVEAWQAKKISGGRTFFFPAVSISAVQEVNLEWPSKTLTAF